MQPSGATTTAPAANPTTSAQALTNLQQFQTGAKSPTDFLNQAQNQYNVSGAQQNVTGLQSAIQNTTNLLNNVAPSVMGRTGNSLVTSAQAGRQIQNEQAPINTNLQQQNTDLGNAQSAFTTANTQADTAANLGLQGQTNQQSYLQNIYNALYKQEQDAAASQLEQQKLAEQAREFNLTPKGGSIPGFSFPSPGGGGNNGGGQPSVSLQGSMSLKTPGVGTSGYNFSYGNNPISALTYATLNNVPVTQVLSTMAQSGDKTASQAMIDIANNGGKPNAAILSKYSSLFWQPSVAPPSPARARVSSNTVGAGSLNPNR